MFNDNDFKRFVIENSVIGIFKEPVTFKSGRKCNVYVNWRNVVEDAYLTKKLVDYVIGFVHERKIEPDCFYGVPEGATKLGILTQYEWAKQSPNFSKASHVLAMGRAKPKDHGAPSDKYFVGMPRGKVVVLEDTTTTGESLILSIKNLIESGINVVAAISLTNRMEKRDDGSSVSSVIQSMGIPYYELSRLTDILRAMKKEISEPDKREVEKYFEKYGLQRFNWG